MGAHVVRPQVLVARVAAVDGLAHAERVREPVQPVPDVRADHQRVRSSSWLSSISLLRSPSSLLSPLYIRTLALHSSGVVLSHAQPGPAPLSSLHCSNVPGSFSAEGVQDRYTTPGILGVPLGAVSSFRFPFPVPHSPFPIPRFSFPLSVRVYRVSVLEAPSCPVLLLFEHPSVHPSAPLVFTVLAEPTSHVAHCSVSQYVQGTSTSEPALWAGRRRCRRHKYVLSVRI